MENQVFAKLWTTCHARLLGLNLATSMTTCWHLLLQPYFCRHILLMMKNLQEWKKVSLISLFNNGQFFQKSKSFLRESIVTLLWSSVSKKVISLSHEITTLLWNNQSSCLIIANPKFYCWVGLFLRPIIEQLTFGLQFYFHLAENSLFCIVYCCFMYKCCWVFKKGLYSFQKIYIIHWLLTSMILRVC